MAKQAKPEPVMVLPQRGPKIIASTARVYSPGYAIRLGIDLVRLALPEINVYTGLRWRMEIVRQTKEIHLHYIPASEPADVTYVQSWRNGASAKSIMVNIGPALRALGIGAYDAIGTYVANATKHKVVISMNKKIGDK